jgi:hypothetical protein
VIGARHERAFRLAEGELKGESNGAEGGTRTPTVLLPPAPQAGASANSATSAWCEDFQYMREPAPTEDPRGFQLPFVRDVRTASSVADAI